MSKFIAALMQMNSGDDIAANIAQAEQLLPQALQQKASLVALPENAFYMRREGTAAVKDVAMVAHPGIVWAQQAAKKHGIWLLIGSIRALEAGASTPFNRSVMVAPDGTIAAHYDKLHLFDVTLEGGHSYRESAQAMAGANPTLLRTPLANIGLSICYDVRFPQLYRQLALAGAELLSVPSAFTRPTGAAHWEVLLRARAIENACYVLAPAQAGVHPGGRETYGHSMMIDPWGSIIAQAGADGPQVITAVIDTAQVASVRAQLPVLQHHRQWGDVVVIEKN
jgi:predicted amidohydrolase